MVWPREEKGPPSALIGGCDREGNGQVLLWLERWAGATAACPGHQSSLLLELDPEFLWETIFTYICTYSYSHSQPVRACPGYRVASGMDLWSRRVDGTQALGQRFPGRDALFPLELEGRHLQLPGPGSQGGPTPE